MVEGVRWVAPKDGVYKINSDAAIFHREKVGLGSVMRDAKGEVIAATCVKMDGGYAVDVAEALAARHGLLIALEAGLRRVVVETDNLKLYTYLKQKTKEVSEFGFLVADIIKLSEQCDMFFASFVRRLGNRVAHAMAKLSNSFDGLQVWVEESPPEAISLVMDDMAKLQ